MVNSDDFAQLAAMSGVHDLFMDDLIIQLHATIKTTQNASWKGKRFYLQEPEKMFEIHDAGEKFVVFWNGPREYRKAIAQWFEERNCPVGKPQYKTSDGFVDCADYLSTACDKDEALLAKLTWGGQ